MFLLILSSILVSDVVVAGWMFRRGRGLWPSVGLLLLGAFPVVHLLWMLVDRQTSLRAHEWVPMPLIALSYLWSLIVAPLSALAIGLVALAKVVLARRRPPQPPDTSRRAFLAASVALAPPVFAGGVLAAALPRLGDFRIRRLRLPIPGLPDALDGLAICHLSDLHYGKFTSAPDIDRVVDAVNALDADLILFTGDLVDLSLKDLPAALEMLGRLRSRAGLFACEGNHDLIDDGGEFRRRVREAGVALLLDEARTVDVRGGRVRLHGVTWGRDEAERRAAVARSRRLLEERTLPILLAHHPHCFDDAEGFPLTLSGHTHGGMLMWNERLGAGPILYRYWSGPYARAGRSLVVSNGVGNWFPLRTHAPAEIIHLTLAREA